VIFKRVQNHCYTTSSQIFALFFNNKTCQHSFGPISKILSLQYFYIFLSIISSGKIGKIRGSSDQGKQGAQEKDKEINFTEKKTEKEKKQKKTGKFVKKY